MNTIKRFSERILLYPVGILLALTTFAYLPAWRSFFIKDDISLLTSAGLDLLGALQHSWPGGFFRPTAELLIAAQYQLFDLTPLPYHLLSFAAHIGSVFCAYRLFNLLPSLRPIALLGAGFFALHPLNSETVSWISGQLGLFSSLCALVTLYLIGAKKHFLGVLVIFLLGLGCYENFLITILLWGALCCFDLRFRARLQPLPLIGLAVPALGYLYWRFNVLHLAGGNYQTAFDLKSGAINIAYYLYLLAGGSALGGRVFHYHSDEIAAHFLHIFTPLLIFNGLLLIAYAFYRTKEDERVDLSILLPIAWIAIALLPVFFLSERPRRLAYLAVPGSSLLIAHIFIFLQEKTRLGCQFAKTGIACYILTLTFTLHSRNDDWHAAGLLERDFPVSISSGCHTLVVDVPNLLGDALFFNTISMGKWLQLNGIDPTPTIYASFETAVPSILEPGCYLRYTDGVLRPVRETNPQPYFTRGRNWALAQ